MLYPLFILIAVIMLAGIAFRSTPYDLSAQTQPARWLMRAALVLMGFYVAFWLFFGFGEIFSGDFSGASHLLPAVLIIFLMLLARRRPLEAGIVLVILGVLASGLFIASRSGEWTFRFQAALIGGIPFLLFGLLFLSVSILACPKA